MQLLEVYSGTSVTFVIVVVVVAVFLLSLPFFGIKAKRLILTSQ